MLDTDNTTLARNGYWPAAAMQYLEEGKYAKAVELCQRMLEQDGRLLSGRTILGRALYHAGLIEQAREQFLQILRIDANHLVALKYMGDILFYEGQEAAAMAHYRRVFELDANCQGLVCPLSQRDVMPTTRLTLKRTTENAVRRDRSPLREPAFITETVADIYRDQGYLKLAEDVYRRLLHSGANERIAAKLKEVEDKLSKGKDIYENPSCQA